MAKRIYKVLKQDSTEVRLVRATSVTQAINHVSKPLFTGAVATTEDIVENRDVVVEDAVVEPKAE